MREIKFRAWDKLSESWVYGGAVMNLHYSGKVGSFMFDNDHHSLLSSLNLEWVQCTGLTDQNGVEVYEGDILSYSFITNSGKSVAEHKTAVKWLDHVAGFDFDALHLLDAKIYVVGNIYENPELLDK